ncbi:Fanconi-associated nuclease 1 [Dermatophagoides pteronyssinus]|uniref:Fanconi-associated nuclease n=1 Tax=Dermatophagoides pteronyssinus TaxID=6956 RepID=A0ABQ8IY03_DERPT|nr:Fanconi-associated nuclease 1 [Dermatophagoides pteronyssinus]
MTTKVGNKKQKTILDFFKKTNDNVKNSNISSINSKNLDVITIVDDTDNINVNDKNNNNDDKCDESKKFLANNLNIINQNNKRPLDVEILATKESKSVENPIQEINYFNENLCQFLFEELDINDKSNQDFNEIDTNVNGEKIEPKSMTIDNEQQQLYSNSVKMFLEFRHIIQTVLENPLNEHLFNEQDWKTIQDLTSLDGSIQLLFIRLYMRKHDWIRIANIKYPQLFAEGENNNDHSNQLEILLKSGFLLDHTSLKSIEDGFSALTFPEIKNFLKKYNGFKMPKSTQKSKVIEAFLHYIRTTRSVCMTSKTIQEQVLQRLRNFCQDKCIRINETKSEILDRIFLLYHSPNDLLENFEDSNEDHWYRRALGDYYVDKKINLVSKQLEANIYCDRDEFSEFVKAFTIYCEIVVLNNQKRFDEVINRLFPFISEQYDISMIKWSDKDSQLAEFLRPFTATGMYIRCLHQCLTSFDKNRLHLIFVANVLKLLGQDIYGLRYRPHWYIRASLISQNYLKNPELAEKFCMNGLSDPSVRYDHRLELYNRLLKLKKQSNENLSDLCPEYHKQNLYKKRTIVASYRHIENETDRKNFFVANHKNGDVEMISVEEVVRRHYLNEGYTNGIHCESKVYHLLFELLLCDILFSTNIPDTFRYNGQRVPLDLCYDSFYQQRKSLIDDRIDEISRWSRDEIASNIIKAINTEYPIDIEYIAENNLHDIAYCMTAEKLAKILQMLATNYRHLRKGFPDLIMWNRDTEQFKAIEVKGPMDRISNIQSIWLSKMTEIELDCELCTVKPKDDQA